MATNANPYVVNIVPLQGIATGITSSSDTAGQIINLQTNVANIQSMVNYDSKTISTDFITSFTPGNTIQITENINLSSASLYSNGTSVSLNSSSNLQFTNSSYISGTASTISFVNAGNEILKIMPNGSLQYTSPPTSLSTGINVSGFIYVSESAYVKALYQTSDRSQKTNIAPFSTCLDDILKLEPCTFNWLNSNEPDIGFIAQDVQKVWPSLTSEGTSIAYSRFVPLLLEGLRELNERVKILEGLRKTESR
uniref:Peptidase S74 domain-containing protein n=1 Tax=viral metagenome TaxID=1070528 RepID=A0A6C0AMG5_9ZZZZ